MCRVKPTNHPDRHSKSIGKKKPDYGTGGRPVPNYYKREVFIQNIGWVRGSDTLRTFVSRPQKIVHGNR